MPRATPAPPKTPLPPAPSRLLSAPALRRLHGSTSMTARPGPVRPAPSGTGKEQEKADALRQALAPLLRRLGEFRNPIFFFPEFEVFKPCGWLE